MELQKHFVRSVQLYFKKEGEAWLAKLPGLIEYCEQKWSMKMYEPYKLSVNYVAPAKMEDGKEVVVKICIPGEGFSGELEALQLLGDKGIVQLIDVDKEHGILILEKLTPGHTLAEVDEEEESCKIAAKVIKTVTKKPPLHSTISTTRARENSLRNIVRKYPQGVGPISHSTLEKALSVFIYMNQTSEKRFILHGDFHHYNVLASEERGWTVIDPKGLVGEIEYDLIQFMLNKLPEEGAYEVIEKRVETFSKELNLNKQRLLLWGYCHTVLATAWSADDDGSYSKTFYQGIEIFERLYRAEFGAEIASLRNSE